MQRTDIRERRTRPNRAFTLLELLIVIAIIALLLTILLPALSAAKENSREAVCRANLRQLGAGIETYATSNDGFLCSGAFDPEVANGRDGPVDAIGWVADQVNSGSGVPAKQLCPSNPARYNQKLGANGNVYTADQAADLIMRGYNTNYTQSWYMARTEFKPGGTGNLKSITGTFWALNESSLKNVASARVPLLGDGRTDLDDLVLGERSVKTMTDGPYLFEYGVQDYRDFGPAHGRGGWLRFKQHDRVRANILFADGHVGYFQDVDHDGEFGLDINQDPPVQKDVGPEVFDGLLSTGRRYQPSGS